MGATRRTNAVHREPKIQPLAVIRLFYFHTITLSILREAQAKKRQNRLLLCYYYPFIYNEIMYRSINAKKHPAR